MTHKYSSLCGHFPVLRNVSSVLKFDGQPPVLLLLGFTEFVFAGMSTLFELVNPGADIIRALCQTYGVTIRVSATINGRDTAVQDLMSGQNIEADNMTPPHNKFRSTVHDQFPARQETDFRNSQKAR